MKYSANYQNGGNATFEWEGDPTDEEQMDALLDAAYEAAPTGLCHQCARDFDISDDNEVYEIRETESGTKVYEEQTWDDRIRESAANATALNAKLTTELIDTRKQRDRLASILRKEGYSVDPHTYAVIRH